MKFNSQESGIFEKIIDQIRPLTEKDYYEIRDTQKFIEEN
jgi:hypothetical protein